MWAVGGFLFLLMVSVRGASLYTNDLRIVGGETAYIKSVPYQVSIELKRTHHCGGSILSSSWILTAAHCVYGKASTSLQVRAGTDKLQQGGSVHLVAYSMIHDNYRSGSADWDVAVVKLSTPITLSGVTKAVNLPAAGRVPSTNSPVVVSGWGLTTPQKGSSARSSGRILEASLPTQLRKVTVRVIAKTSCIQSYGTALSQHMICAAAPGKDACTYDSGGPLVDSSNTQVGIVSWGKGCADPAYPGVYVYLGDKEVRAFVKKNTGL